jgi:hypothetical protein
MSVEYMTPRYVRAFLLAALCFYFKGHAEYPYFDDERKTSIIITDSEPENAQYMAQYPSVVVQGGGAQFNNDGVGSNLADFAFPKKDYRTVRTQQFTVSGSLSIHIICDSCVDSEEIANEIGVFLSSVRPVALSMLQLQHLSAVTQGETKAYKRIGQDVIHITTLSLNYVYAVRVQVTPIDPGPLLEYVDIIMKSKKGPIYTDGPKEG